MITAFVTNGEGYHNFHHQFPMDYRNAIKWYQYDPTKWFIWVCFKLGLASHLKTFPENEVKKGELTMQLKRLRETQEHLQFAPDANDLPVVSWESCTSPLSFARKVHLLTLRCSQGAGVEETVNCHRRFHSRRVPIDRRAPWWSPLDHEEHRQGRNYCILWWRV